jgi:omega-6 fatty acid desaturase (delta-12 desaturase)
MKTTSQKENQALMLSLLKPYQQSDTWLSLWQLANSIVPYIALWVLMYYSLRVSYLLTLGLSVLAAGFMVRTFIIFHDCGHGSFFNARAANDAVGIITGVLTYTPYYRWRHDHAVHHATAGDLDRRGTGDVMTLTVDEFKALSPLKQLGYRIWRHPLVLFTIGPTLVFAFANRLPLSGGGRRERWGVHYTNLALLGLITGLIFLMGWKAFLMIQIPILMIGSGVGVWLFYVQHNFEGTYWQRHNQWDFYQAALQGSSFYKLPIVLQWFSGNIGFHHIHHLSPRIPNYLLPKCFKENPVFQVQPLTLLASLRSLKLRLWDEKRSRMVGFSALNPA